MLDQYKKRRPYYRPLKLPLPSKVYEREIFEQESNYFESFFNESLCKFIKAHSMQHPLFKLNFMAKFIK